MSSVTYSVVHVETTGLRRHDRILEVAIIGIDEAGTTTSVFESVLDPGRDPGPTSVHGLVAEDCRGAPTFLALARVVHERLAGGILVGHNLRFDWGALRREFERCGVRFLQEPGGLCTLLACRTLGVPARLDAACAALGIPGPSSHGARGDAEATARLWLALGHRGAFVGRRCQPLRPGLGAHRLPRSSPPRIRQTAPRRSAWETTA